MPRRAPSGNPSRTRLVPDAEQRTAHRFQPTSEHDRLTDPSQPKGHPIEIPLSS